MTVVADPQVTLTDLANQAALQRAGAVNPEWVGVARAVDAISLPDKTLLHAGPPFINAREPSGPIASSAVICCLYEGWAHSEQEAEALIASGEVTLRPAQEFNVVTPLAAVISPSAYLVEVADAQSGDRCWSLLSSGPGAQIRFGSRNPALLGRLKYRDEVLGPAFTQCLKERAISLNPIALTALLSGDDLHYQTTVATNELKRALYLDQMGAGERREIEQTLDSSPLFFLTLWMASCRLILRAMMRGDKASNCSLVVAMAGNGESLGICLASNPEQWVVTTAPTPQGPSGNNQVYSVAAATGDSGVIDAAGFGAQYWHQCPDIDEVMGGWHQTSKAAVADYMEGVLASFQSADVVSGLDSRSLLAGARGNTTTEADEVLPLAIAIARLEQSGQQGLLGKGVVKIPFFFNR